MSKKSLLSAAKSREELPVPPGIIPHFLLKRKKKTAPAMQAGTAVKNKIH
ncbi:hypothetical protein [Salinithrix halophila]|uniref:Uncharacterized protein n=1 Tax=Salinithrix halophila TaxID=1485204 RepID=A0ABV8JCK5_9BACL